jgi:hypothetical protein
MRVLSAPSFPKGIPPYSSKASSDTLRTFEGESTPLNVTGEDIFT